jgi:hypothetical protein
MSRFCHRNLRGCNICITNGWDLWINPLRRVRCHNVTCGPFLGNEWTNTLLRGDWFLEINWLRNTVSMDTETESCKHLENQAFAWEVRRGFRDNAFMKNSNGTLGGCDIC